MMILGAEQDLWCKGLFNFIAIKFRSLPQGQGIKTQGNSQEANQEHRREHNMANLQDFILSRLQASKGHGNHAREC